MRSLSTSHPCQFKLVSSGEMSGPDEQSFDKMVSIYLHRITVNEHYRNATRPQEPDGKEASDRRGSALPAHVLGTQR